jgi:hypothetical protein
MKNFKRIFAEYLKIVRGIEKKDQPLNPDHPSYVKLKQEIEYLDAQKRLVLKQLEAEKRAMKYESENRIQSF